MNPHCDVANHAAVHLERQVLDWFRDMIGFPAASGGVLVSGGSMANLTGLATARHARSGWDDRENGLAGGPRLRVYVSDQGHSCIRKAIELLGIGSANLRIVPTDDRFRMRIPVLESMIAEDRKAGYRPLAVVGSAGSTNTGSIDPLERIAAVCRREDLWFHVDGAYGAPAVMTDRYRDALAGLALADSVAVDPHKWLQIPVEAGVALVRDQSLLRDTFSLVPCLPPHRWRRGWRRRPDLVRRARVPADARLPGLEDLVRAAQPRQAPDHSGSSTRTVGSPSDSTVRSSPPRTSRRSPRSHCRWSASGPCRRRCAVTRSRSTRSIGRSSNGSSSTARSSWQRPSSEGAPGFASASSTAGRGRRMSGRCVRLVRAEAARFIAEDEDETPLVRPLRSASHRWSAIQPAGQRRAAPSTKSGGHPTEKPSAQTEPIC